MATKQGEAAGWTSLRRGQFLDALAASACVERSAALAGMSAAAA